MAGNPPSSTARPPATRNALPSPRSPGGSPTSSPTLSPRQQRRLHHHHSCRQQRVPIRSLPHPPVVAAPVSPPLPLFPLSLPAHPLPTPMTTYRRALCPRLSCLRLRGNRPRSFERWPAVQRAPPFLCLFHPVLPHPPLPLVRLMPLPFFSLSLPHPSFVPFRNPTPSSSPLLLLVSLMPLPFLLRFPLPPLVHLLSPHLSCLTTPLSLVSHFLLSLPPLFLRVPRSRTLALPS